MEKIQEIAVCYGIQDPFLVFNRQYISVVNQNNGSLETKLRKEKPYGHISQVIRDYEKLFEQTYVPRWVIVPPGEVVRLKQGLTKAFVVKGGEVFTIEIGAVYTIKDELTNGHQEIQLERVPPAIHYPGNIQIPDGSEQFFNNTQTREDEDNPHRLSLAELIRRVSN